MTRSTGPYSRTNRGGEWSGRSPAAISPQPAGRDDATDGASMERVIGLAQLGRRVLTETLRRARGNAPDTGRPPEARR